MMPIFDRYVLRNIFISIISTLIFLLGVDFLVQSADQGNQIGRGHYTFWIMAYSLILDIPDRIIEFMPAAVLVGAIMGLGQMGAQNELTVVRTSGISRLKMSRSGLILALVFGGLLIVIGEYIAPSLSSKSELMVNQALGRSSQTLLRQGIWVNDPEGAVHIGRLNDDGSLGNLRFFRRDANNTVSISTAQQAVFAGDHWNLADTSGFKITPNAVETFTPDNVWQRNLTPAMLSSTIDTTTASTLKELSNVIAFLKANHLNHANESLRLWQRLLLPLTTLTMLLLALPFAFNTQRSAGGARLIIGILLGVAYYVVQGILSRMGLLWHWPPILGALAPILIFGLPPLFILMRD